mmetsp:Transcript_18637/g.50970  ORF Transcript_18637/g.50970 Transcript_18637/m.50970 type:complete len:238 (-) Transcript_18637:1253-1966(-)
MLLLLMLPLLLLPWQWSSSLAHPSYASSTARTTSCAMLAVVPRLVWHSPIRRIAPAPSSGALLWLLLLLLLSPLEPLHSQWKQNSPRRHHHSVSYPPPWLILCQIGHLWLATTTTCARLAVAQRLLSKRPHCHYFQHPILFCPCHYCCRVCCLHSPLLPPATVLSPLVNGSHCFLLGWETAMKSGPRLPSGRWAKHHLEANDLDQSVGRSTRQMIWERTIVLPIASWKIRKRCNRAC